MHQEVPDKADAPLRLLHSLGFVMGANALPMCTSMFLVGMINSIEDSKHSESPVCLVIIMMPVSPVVNAVPKELPMVITTFL